MATFAQIAQDGHVIEVIVVDDDAINNLPYPDSEPVGQAMLAESGFDGTWLQCSYSGSFRGCYPGPGYTYDPVLDQFAPPAE